MPLHGGGHPPVYRYKRPVRSGCNMPTLTATKFTYFERDQPCGVGERPSFWWPVRGHGAPEDTKRPNTAMDTTKWITGPERELDEYWSRIRTLSSDEQKRACAARFVDVMRTTTLLRARTDLLALHSSCLASDVPISFDAEQSALWSATVILGRQIAIADARGKREAMNAASLIMCGIIVQLFDAHPDWNSFVHALVGNGDGIDGVPRAAGPEDYPASGPQTALLSIDTQDGYTAYYMDGAVNAVFSPIVSQVQSFDVCVIPDTSDHSVFVATWSARNAAQTVWTPICRRHYVISSAAVIQDRFSLQTVYNCGYNFPYAQYLLKVDISRYSGSTDFIMRSFVNMSYNHSVISTSSMDYAGYRFGNTTLHSMDHIYVVVDNDVMEMPVPVKGPGTPGEPDTPVPVELVGTQITPTVAVVNADAGAPVPEATVGTRRAVETACHNREMHTLNGNLDSEIAASCELGVKASLVESQLHADWSQLPGDTRTVIYGVLLKAELPTSSWAEREVRLGGRARLRELTDGWKQILELFQQVFDTTERGCAKYARCFFRNGKPFLPVPSEAEVVAFCVRYHRSIAENEQRVAAQRRLEGIPAQDPQPNKPKTESITDKLLAHVDCTFEPKTKTQLPVSILGVGVESISVPLNIGNTVNTTISPQTQISVSTVSPQPPQTPAPQVWTPDGSEFRPTEDNLYIRHLLQNHHGEGVLRYQLACSALGLVPTRISHRRYYDAVLSAQKHRPHDVRKRSKGGFKPNSDSAAIRRAKPAREMREAGESPELREESRIAAEDPAQYLAACAEVGRVPLDVAKTAVARLHVDTIFFTPMDDSDSMGQFNRLAAVDPGFNAAFSLNKLPRAASIRLEPLPLHLDGYSAYLAETSGKRAHSLHGNIRQVDAARHNRDMHSLNGNSATQVDDSAAEALRRAGAGTKAKCSTPIPSLDSALFKTFLERATNVSCSVRAPTVLLNAVDLIQSKRVSTMQGPLNAKFNSIDVEGHWYTMNTENSCGVVMGIDPLAEVASLRIASVGVGFHDDGIKPESFTIAPIGQTFLKAMNMHDVSSITAVLRTKNARFNSQVMLTYLQRVIATIGEDGSAHYCGFVEHCLNCLTLAASVCPDVSRPCGYSLGDPYRTTAFAGTRVPVVCDVIAVSLEGCGDLFDRTYSVTSHDGVIFGLASLDATWVMVPVTTDILFDPKLLCLWIWSHLRQCYSRTYNAVSTQGHMTRTWPSASHYDWTRSVAHVLLVPVPMDYQNGTRLTSFPIAGDLDICESMADVVNADSLDIGADIDAVLAASDIGDVLRLRNIIDTMYSPGVSWDVAQMLAISMTGRFAPPPNVTPTAGGIVVSNYFVGDDWGGAPFPPGAQSLNSAAAARWEHTHTDALGQFSYAGATAPNYMVARSSSEINLVLALKLLTTVTGQATLPPFSGFSSLSMYRRACPALAAYFDSVMRSFDLPYAVLHGYFPSDNFRQAFASVFGPGKFIGGSTSADAGLTVVGCMTFLGGFKYAMPPYPRLTADGGISDRYCVIPYARVRPGSFGKTVETVEFKLSDIVGDLTSCSTGVVNYTANLVVQNFVARSVNLSSVARDTFPLYLSDYTAPPNFFAISNNVGSAVSPSWPFLPPQIIQDWTTNARAVLAQVGQDLPVVPTAQYVQGFELDFSTINWSTGLGGDASAPIYLHVSMAPMTAASKMAHIPRCVWLETIPLSELGNNINVTAIPSRYQQAARRLVALPKSN